MYSATELRAAVRAGEMQRRYKQRMKSATDCAARRTPLGARLPDRRARIASVQCALITRDEGFFRDYFKGLRVIVPRPTQ